MGEAMNHLFLRTQYQFNSNKIRTKPKRPHITQNICVKKQASRLNVIGQEPLVSPHALYPYYGFHRPGTPSLRYFFGFLYGHNDSFFAGHRILHFPGARQLCVREHHWHRYVRCHPGDCCTPSRFFANHTEKKGMCTGGKRLNDYR